MPMLTNEPDPKTSIYLYKLNKQNNTYRIKYSLEVVYDEQCI